MPTFNLLFHGLRCYVLRSKCHLDLLSYVITKALGNKQNRRIAALRVKNFFTLLHLFQLYICCHYMQTDIIYFYIPLT